MTATLRVLFPFLWVCSFPSTTVTRTSLLITVAANTLPEEVFWNNTDWPSDLKSKGGNEEEESDDNEELEDRLENPYIVEGQSNLNAIGDDPEAAELTALFQNYTEVEAKTLDGSWIGNLYLPDGAELLDEPKFQISCHSTYPVHIHYNGKSTSVSTGEYFILTLVNNERWVTKAFLPLENPYIIQGQPNLDQIGNDPDGNGLTAIFKDNNRKEVEVKTWNGSWIGNVYLPDGTEIPNGSKFQLSCGSSWGVNVHNNGVSKSVSYGEQLMLVLVNSVWMTEEEYNPAPYPIPPPTFSPTPNPNLLKGTVLFAQSQIIPSKHGIENDSQPHLTALRKTLVMLRPHNLIDEDSSVQMIVRDAEGEVVSNNIITMNNPEDIPKQEGWIEIDGIDMDDINFPDSLVNPYVIEHQSNLNQIGNDPESVGLTEKMNEPNKNEVEIRTWNGSWVSSIFFPNSSSIPQDSKIQITCNSGYNVNAHYLNTITGGWRTKALSHGDVVVFLLVGGVWICEDDSQHSKYIFGHGFYTTTLEAEWVFPGMTLEFASQEKEGFLEDISIGGITELVITTLDAGFLTEPRNQFTFRDDATTHREYFETTMASRLVVVQYETMHFTEIMLPSGKLYTDKSDDDGGWHSGDMRQYIGKLLLSHGIDLANYGISSSKGHSESSHPFTCAFLAAHNTVGMYQNGRIVHGGSGGNGMITLDSSTGNEFSHEVGHNYGLGHYPGGFDGSVHSSSDKINSSWGWDSQTNLFTPNFGSSDTGQDQCQEGKCQPPFLGKYKYGTDSMAGGYPMRSNRFTLYTPFTSRIIQQFLEGKAVWDPSSSTGFRKYDPLSKQMEEYVNNANNQKVPRLFRVPVTTLVGYYDPSPTRGLEDYIYPALHGAYGFVYNDDGGPSTGTANGCELVVKTSSGSSPLVFTLSTSIHSSTYMNKFHVNIATEDEPNEAMIYCYNELRASLMLNGPNENEPPLTYTVNGVQWDDHPVTPTTPTTDSPTIPPTDSPTIPPTDSPTIPPTGSPTIPPTGSPTIPPTGSPTASPTGSPTASLTPVPISSPVSPPTGSSAPVTTPTTPNPDYCKMFVFSLTTDNFGYETSFELINEFTGGTRSAGGLYSSSMTFNEIICLDNGRYTFTISDSYGDGICCENGNGNYQVKLESQVIKQGGEFGESETFSFDVGPPGPTNAPTVVPTCIETDASCTTGDQCCSGRCRVDKCD
jgi:hypothetical protein